MKFNLVTISPAETKKFAKSLTRQILRSSSQENAFIIGLVGELGSGKTCFLQGFACGLGISERILSPTYLIMRKHQIPNSLNCLCGNYKKRSDWFQLQTNSKSQILNPERRLKSRIVFKSFFHIDAYRIKDPKELLDLGFANIIKNPENIVAIEWADRIEKILPQNTILLKFKVLGNKKRRILVKNKNWSQIQKI